MLLHWVFKCLKSMPPSAVRGRRHTQRLERLGVESLEARNLPSLLTPVDYPIGSAPFASAATADLNGDGRLDLAVHRAVGPSSVGVLLGNGDGTFQPVRNFAAGTSWGGPASIAIGDLNADGRNDLATANDTGTVSVLLSNGDGTFAAAQNLLIDDLSIALSVAMGDLNQDGKLDLAVGAWNSAPWSNDSAYLHVLLGNGDGTFAAPTDYPMPASDNLDRAAYSVQLADLNNDGKLDAATANNDYTVSVLLGNGNGTLQAPTDFATGAGPTVWIKSLKVADLNADGNLDLAASDSNGTTASVLLGVGTGAFATYQSYTTGGNSTSVAVADLNQDGRPDLVTANTDSHNVSALLGNGDGTFQTRRNYPAGLSPWSIVVGAFDGDAFPDVAVTHYESSSLSVLRNDGNWSSPGLPSIRISDVTKVEGARGTTYFIFVVTLSASTSAPVTVNFATANGTAKTADGDYVASSGTLTFAPGETTKIISIAVKGDRKKEGSETFYLDLFGNSGNSLFTKNRGVGTILNDD